MSKSSSFDKKELLKPENMIYLYSCGAFPMADKTGELDWYKPEIRTIIRLSDFKTPRSLKKFMHSSSFVYRFDSAILDVIRCCASRTETWISEELIQAYQGLIDFDHLHSVEVFLNNELVGGLYGVTYRGAFFGESMFSKVPQASKCALVKLIEKLIEKNYILLDVQFQTEHLKMFGAVEIPPEEFSSLLNKSAQLNVSFQ